MMLNGNRWYCSLSVIFFYQCLSSGGFLCYLPVVSFAPCIQFWWYNYIEINQKKTTVRDSHRYIILLKKVSQHSALTFFVPKVINSNTVTHQKHPPVNSHQSQVFRPASLWWAVHPTWSSGWIGFFVGPNVALSKKGGRNPNSFKREK